MDIKLDPMKYAVPAIYREVIEVSSLEQLASVKIPTPGEVREILDLKPDDHLIVGIVVNIGNDVLIDSAFFEAFIAYKDSVMTQVTMLDVDSVVLVTENIGMDQHGNVFKFDAVEHMTNYIETIITSVPHWVTMEPPVKNSK